MQTKKTHRRYPDRAWDYKAISTIMNDGGTKRNVMYHTLSSKGEKSEGVEVYTGENYIPDSKDKSYSKMYKMKDIPTKYKKVVEELKEVHKKTKWSTAKRVDEN